MTADSPDYGSLTDQLADHDRRLAEAAADVEKELADIAAAVADLYPTEQELADQLADLEVSSATIDAELRRTDTR